MPIRKYRRVEDLPEPPLAPDARAGIEAACRLSQLSQGLGRRFNAPRGVHRFRSIEEADAHRRSWELPPLCAVDDADPDVENVVALLEGVPGAYDRAVIGRQQAVDSETVPLADL